MNKYKIYLAGTPNVGKSTIFNTLTFKNQHTGNWSGKTVENAKGKYKYNSNIYEIYDLPGTYSLDTTSKEEEIAVNLIKENKENLIVVVCNAVSLIRGLVLVLQILNITKNIVVVVNLMDEAKNKKIDINIKKLSNLLEVPVISTSATYNRGIDKLKETIEKQVKENKNTSNKSLEVFSKNEIITKCKCIHNQVVTYNNDDYIKRERKIDKILTNKITGIPIMLIMLFIIFWLTIIGSNFPSEILSKFLFSLEEPLMQLLGFLPNFYKELLVLGLYKTTSWVISVMLPPMLIFFPLFTILEDCGLLPRIAFNVDPAFSKCNSCGKQALTMCMGIGCNAVGVTGCRIIESKRERLQAILTNSFMPCNGRYPTLIAIITIFFINSDKSLLSSLICALILVLLILLSIIITLIINKLLSISILKGNKTPFILELPDYRKIRVGKVIIKSIIERTFHILGRAILVAAPAGILIYLITNITFKEITILQILSNILDPLGKIMALDGKILLSFILGLPANEIVMPIMLMTYLESNTLTSYTTLNTLKNILIDNNWTTTTAISFLIFTIFHFPCATTILTIKKETNSWYYTFLSCLIPLIIGIILCILVNTIF